MNSHDSSQTHDHGRTVTSEALAGRPATFALPNGQLAVMPANRPGMEAEELGDDQVAHYRQLAGLPAAP